jgi:hypothetical protein
MHITPGQFPAQANLVNHAAKAYGIRPATPAAQPSQSNAPASFTIKPDVYEPSTPAQQLVAGTVAGSVNFDASPRSAPASAYAFQMYTRAADKVEAAVGVQVGRTMDVKG